MNFEKFCEMTDKVREEQTANEAVKNVVRIPLDRDGKYDPPYMLPIVDLSISARPSEDSIDKNDSDNETKSAFILPKRNLERSYRSWICKFRKKMGV